VSSKYTTWAACGGLAAGAVGAAAAHSRKTGLAAAVVAGAWLYGTFDPRSRLFGAPASARAEPGTFALTFDDGPDPRHTGAIAELLRERGHRATFFVLGRAVRAHPDVAAATAAAGHELASHGDDHRLLALTPPWGLRDQLRAAENAVLDATGSPPAPLFRAPHGVRSPWLAPVARAAGYRVCAWDGSVFDTALPGVDAIVERVRPLIGPGRVILLHDGDGSGGGAPRDQTVAALPAILDEAERLGLRSVPLSTLLEPG
jgi:peptidoglycan/xylan/chitin deacetylase (PgdA/CDA1 family)